MSPEFSKAVDKVFTTVIDLLDRIEDQSYGDFRAEQQRIREVVLRAENELGARRRDWELAKIALVAWIDDLLIETPWRHQDAWREECLERVLLGSHELGDLFYEHANEATKLASKDALEVFYVCVVLNFRGLYRQPDSYDIRRRLGLPDTVEEWVKRTGDAIRLGQGVPTLIETEREGDGAPPLLGRDEFLKRTVWTVITTAIAIVMAITLFLGRAPAPPADSQETRDTVDRGTRQ